MILPADLKKETAEQKNHVFKEAAYMDPKKEREYADEIPDDEEEREDEAYEPTYRDGSAKNECWAGNE